jgi:hypothetical protein
VLRSIISSLRKTWTNPLDLSTKSLSGVTDQLWALLDSSSSTQLPVVTRKKPEETKLKKKAIQKVHLSPQMEVNNTISIASSSNVVPFEVGNPIPNLSTLANPYFRPPNGLYDTFPFFRPFLY